MIKKHVIIKSVCFIFVLYQSFLLIKNLLYRTDNGSLENNFDYKLYDGSHYANHSNNIIFIETNAQRIFLTFKQTCSLESAAKNNPDLNILIFSISAKIKHENILTKIYPNIKYYSLNLDELFNNSYLHYWWFSGVLVTEPHFRSSHLLDALRYTLTYKYGGFYSDLDTITIRNLSPLRQYSAFSLLNPNNHEIGTGFMHFTKEHEFLSFILKRFNLNYKPFDWNSNGPNMIKMSLQLYCNISTLEPLVLKIEKIKTYKKLNQNEICNLFLLPNEVSYPYHYNEAKILFDDVNVLDISKFIDTYSIHFYGFLTENLSLKKNQRNIYEHFASLNCPVSYNYFYLSLS
jgi:lactosylceramide 4-alpha-galactosyltransferase